MATKIINGNFTVATARKGEPVMVKPGEPFDFTDDEIKDIKAAHGDDALRDPVNEAPAKSEAKGKGDGKGDGKSDL